MSIVTGVFLIWVGSQLNWANIRKEVNVIIKKTGIEI
jgi:hypothetical protein